MCVFSGQPYSDLSNEEAELRSRGMRKEQEAVERWGSEGKSLRAAAKRLPINRAKYERVGGREGGREVCIIDGTSKQV